VYFCLFFVFNISQTKLSQGSLREMTVRSQTSDALARTLQRDCEALQRDKAALTATTRTQEAAVNDMRVRVATLEQQVTGAKDATTQQVGLQVLKFN
jgi:hypothetical protein